MKKRIVSAYLLFTAFSALGYSVTFPTAPAAGQSGSTAIHRNSASFVAWADGYTDMVFGEDSNNPQFRNPAVALGKAEGVNSGVVCLGRDGRITLTFSQGIADGVGFDFAVFENAFDDTFLELAFVEVSSDGLHFVRFPHFSNTPALVPKDGKVYPFQIYGYAGKYAIGYGTPFDLSELIAVSNSIVAGGHSLTAEYVTDFSANMPHLDLSNVQYVRLVDVVGDGNTPDCEGFPIYDPYKTTGTAGFDLDAVGVIHQPMVAGDPQTIAFADIPHQKRAFGSVQLSASASSGLPVSFEVQSGPATNSGNALYFTGTGTVEVVANQAGDATYAPAAPVLQSFIIAEEIQHIFVEPVPNQLKNGGTVQVNAYSSGGLPVKMQVQSGPASVIINEDTHLLNLGSESGSVTLRAFQPGDSVTAPADDVYVHFEMVESGASNAPVAFADWFSTNAAPSIFIQPANDSFGQPASTLGFEFQMNVAARCRVMESTNLTLWTNAIPKIIGQTHIGNTLHLNVLFPVDSSNRFYRLQFEAQ